MFEKDKSSKTRAALMRQDTEAVAALEENLSLVEGRVDDLARRLSEGAEKLDDMRRQVTDANTHSSVFVACPRCGLVADIEKVPTSGGFLRDKAKRCRFCEHVAEGPILKRQEESEPHGA